MFANLFPVSANSNFHVIYEAHGGPLHSLTHAGTDRPPNALPSQNEERKKNDDDVAVSREPEVNEVRSERTQRGEGNFVIGILLFISLGVSSASTSALRCVAWLSVVGYPNASAGSALNQFRLIIHP